MTHLAGPVPRLPFPPIAHRQGWLALLALLAVYAVRTGLLVNAPMPG